MKLYVVRHGETIENSNDCLCGRINSSLTEKGIEQAKKTIKKHKVLSSFFTKVLGVNVELADKNACKIEHVISKESFEALKKHFNKN